MTNPSHALALLVLALLAAAPAAATPPAEGPGSLFARYAQAWSEGRYAAMHALVCAPVREGSTEAEFAARYAAIFGGLGATALSVTPGPPDFGPAGEAGGRCTLPFAVAMRTRAGPLAYEGRASLAVEPAGADGATAWRIAWTPAMIHPDLGPGDKVRVVRLPGARGRILDRNGEVLAADGEALLAGLVPGKLPARSEEVKLKVARALGLDPAVVGRKVAAAHVRPGHFVPLRAFADDDEGLKETLLALPGVLLDRVATRVYPLGPRACHLTGYVQKANAEDLARRAAEGYAEGDLVGKAGLEFRYESILRATPGHAIRIVGAAGAVKRVLASLEPVDGADLTLTVDARMQSLLHEGLSGEAGVAVALDPRTGETLALVSAPAYDPGAFARGLSDAEWQALRDDPARPLTNRFQRTFCPGSSLKPFVAALGIAAGTLDPAADRRIRGLRWQPGAGWGNYRVKRVAAYPGPSDLANALVHSDNIYFAQVALDLGADAFAAGFARLGVGARFPYAFGLYNSQVAGPAGIRGEVQLADSGYGQGEFLMNPVELAALHTLFANRGDVVKPVLLAGREETGEILLPAAFPPEAVAPVLDSMLCVVKDPGGTGHQAWMKRLPLAGKTGTAEIKRDARDTRGVELGWFTAFDWPERRLLVTMMVEDVKERGGSHFVVPRVKRVFERWLAPSPAAEKGKGGKAKGTEKEKGRRRDRRPRQAPM